MDYPFWAQMYQSGKLQRQEMCQQLCGLPNVSGFPAFLSFVG